MKVGIYCRVSTAEQLKNFSIGTQKKKGIDFAKSLDCEYQEYIDEGISGAKDLLDRPALLQLITDVEDGHIDVIWTIDIDRLSRDLQKSFVIFNTLREHKIMLFINDNLYDFENENDELFNNIKLLFAEYERKKIMARSKRGQAEAVRKGICNNVIPCYGYDSVNKYFVINEAEAEVVREIYQMYLAGRSFFAIANELNNRNIPTKRTKLNMTMTVTRKKQKVKTDDFIWREKTVDSLLKQTLYIGKRTYGKDKIEADLPYLRIIEDDVYDAVQVIRKSKINNRNNKTHFYWLKGMVICGKCGESYYGLKRGDGSKDYHYICLSSRFKARNCGNARINIDWLDRYVRESIMQLPDRVAEQFNVLGTASSRKNTLAKYEEYGAEVSNLNSQKDRLLNLYLDNRIDDTIYNKKLAEIESNLIIATAYFNQYDNQLKIGEQQNDVISILKQIKERLSSLEYNEESRDLIRSIVDQVQILDSNAKSDERRVLVKYRLDKFKLLIQNVVNIDYEISGAIRIRKGYEIKDFVITDINEDKIRIDNTEPVMTLYQTAAGREKDPYYPI